MQYENLLPGGNADICPPIEEEDKCPPILEIRDVEIKDKEIIEKEREQEMRQALTAYGKYSNVFLSDSELAELNVELPDKVEYYIERLSGYIASTGKQYQNHAATILRWAADDNTKDALKRGTPNQDIPVYDCKEGASL